MTFEEAKEKARQGIKVTHKYFTDVEYMTMRENLIIFEDDVKIFADDWLKGKDYLKDGWSLYTNPCTSNF
jgi:ABC-type uncharacterized transport system ATPase subunit